MMDKEYEKFLKNYTTNDLIEIFNIDYEISEFVENYIEDNYSPDQVADIVKLYERGF